MLLVCDVILNFDPICPSSELWRFAAAAAQTSYLKLLLIMVGNVRSRRSTSFFTVHLSCSYIPGNIEMPLGDLRGLAHNFRNLRGVMGGF